MQREAVTLGPEHGGERPETLAAFVRAETQKSDKVIKDAGVKIERVSALTFRRATAPRRT
jgi:hypothetical protein